MFDYNKKKNFTILTPVRTKGDEILESPEFAVKATLEPEVDDRDLVESVNYIRKPFAAKAVSSAVSAIIASVLMIIAIRMNLNQKGQPDLNVSAIALSSLLFSLVALVYSIKSFAELNRNYLLSYIGMVVGGVETCIWVVTVLMGIVTR